MATIFKVAFREKTNADFRYNFALMDTLKVRIDITGATFSFRAVDDDDIEVLLATTANGLIVINNASQGEFGIAVPQTTMAAIPPGTYRCDMIKTQGGQKQCLLDGTLTVVKGIA